MAVLHFTYEGDPSQSDTQAVRYLSGDTDRELAEIDDKEIAFALSKFSDTRLAAAMCVDALADKYARRADIKVGEVSKSMSAISDRLRQRAKDLRTEAGKSAMPFFGGVSEADKQATDANSDNVPPSFRKKMFDSPLANNFDNGNETDSDEAEETP